MKPTPLRDQLSQHKLKMFASKGSLTEALETVRSHLADVPEGRWMVPLYIYHNTLIDHLQEKLVDSAVLDPGIPVSSELFRAIEDAFNQLPNKQLNDPIYKDTYALASALGRVSLT
jgi:hypothetical protein